MSRLEDVVLDLERHSAQAGWDSPPRLYALVEATALRRQEPALADELGIPADADSIAALEQPPLPGSDSAPIEDLLGTIAWPARVDGCALVLERIVLPPEAEAELPDENRDVDGWAAGHPRREDVRVVVGVLRDGSRHSALRLRKHDDDDAVLSGPDLVPALADALAATLASGEPEADPGADPKADPGPETER
ncbi:MAG TPA: PPA1309 family protein [Streptosporangiaceae bacterium]|nr:PPA1309 family protein [Streptosporangiaceae bacterium]